MLDQMWPTLGEDPGAQVAAALGSLTSGYNSLSVVKALPVDYTALATQVGYVYKYVPAHADLIYCLLNCVKDAARPIFSGEQVRMVCVGGGPGTELIGALKFAERLPKRASSIACEIWDRNLPWQAAVAAATETAPTGLSITTSFAQFDWQSADPLAALATIENADVITLSYTLSEVWRYNADNSVSVNLDRIIGALKPGALVLYSDNSGPNFDPYAEKYLFARSDLTVLDRHAHDHMLIGSDEQSSVTADYRQLMGAGSGTMPKLRGNATSAAFLKISA